MAVTSPKAQMPQKAKQLKNLDDVFDAIYPPFQAFYKETVKQSILKKQVRSIFLHKADQRALTLHFNGDTPKCLYNRSNVVHLKDDTEKSNDIVEAFEKWLITGDEKPVIIEILNPQQEGVPMDVGVDRVEQPVATNTAEVEALRLEVAALREAQALRAKINEIKPAQPAAPANEDLARALKEVESLKQQFEALKVAQEQQNAEIGGAKARSIDAVNMASKAIDDAQRARVNAQSVSQRQREAEERAAYETRMLADKASQRINELGSRVENLAQGPAEPPRRKIIRREFSRGEEEESAPTDKKRKQEEEEEEAVKPSPEWESRKKGKRPPPIKIPSPYSQAVFHTICAVGSLFGMNPDKP